MLKNLLIYSRQIGKNFFWKIKFSVTVFVEPKNSMLEISKVHIKGTNCSSISYIINTPTLRNCSDSMFAQNFITNKMIFFNVLQIYNFLAVSFLHTCYYRQTNKNNNSKASRFFHKSIYILH